MQNEKENNKKETKEGKIKENSGKEIAKLPEKSEETQMFKKNNVETNTCRNICKEFGRVNIIIHKHFRELICQYVKRTFEGINFDL